MLFFIKNFFKSHHCNKCNWLFACEDCSSEYERIDKEIKNNY